MRTQKLQVSEIVANPATQIRAQLSIELATEYADLMLDGHDFPPVEVFFDGKKYILADGFHRLRAVKQNRCAEIMASIHDGSKTDALKYALSANANHGKPRSNLDKHRSVELALEEWPKLSDREIAKICAVGNQLVSQTRKELCDSHSCEPQPIRVGADGKERKMPRKRQNREKPVRPQVSRPATEPPPNRSIEKPDSWPAIEEALAEVRGLIHHIEALIPDAHNQDQVIRECHRAAEMLEKVGVEQASAM